MQVMTDKVFDYGQSLLEVQPGRKIGSDIRPEDKYRAYMQVVSGEAGSLEDAAENTGLSRKVTSRWHQAQRISKATKRTVNSLPAQSGDSELLSGSHPPGVQ